MEKLALQVVTPERRVLSLDVDDVVLPSVDGYLGVLPGHAPLLAMLDIGEVSYREGGERHYLAVSGGYAEILRKQVTILARTCEPAEEIDVPRAQRSRDGAESRMKSGSTGQEIEHAEVKLKRAMSRIQVHGRLKG